MSVDLNDQLRIWSAEIDPVIANHRTIPLNSDIEEGELFTRLCVIRVPESITSPKQAVTAYEAETKKLLKVGSIAVLEHDFVLINASDIDTSDQGLAHYVARQNRVATTFQAGLQPDQYLGAIVPKIPIRRPEKNISGMRNAIGAYYLDSALKPRQGYLIEDLSDEQLTMRHRKDIKVPYVLFDLDVRLSSRYL